MEHKSINIPENQNDITLEQFVKYKALLKRELPEREFNKRKLMIFYKLTYNEVEHIAGGDYHKLLAYVDTAIETQHKFVDRFWLDGIEFGFIPNFDEIQAKELFDIKLYSNEDEDLPRLMAILFRRVIKKDAVGNYEIESYRGTDKTFEVLKQTPMSIVLGALFFFRNLRTELQINTQLYLNRQEQKREQEQSSSLKNGVGIVRYINWLRAKLGSLSI